MAKPKIKRPLPPAGDLWHYTSTLIQAAYRIQTGQFGNWGSASDVRVLLDRIVPEFERFNEGRDQVNSKWGDAQFCEYFIAIHKRAHEEHWSEGKLRERLAGLFSSDTSPDEVPEELVRLQDNPSRDTSQGVKEAANYTWAKYLGHGKGDTINKGVTEKAKEGRAKTRPRFKRAI
jgi:hypothetical protein